MSNETSFPISLVVNYNRMIIKCTDVKLNESAVFMVTIYDELEKFIVVKRFVMSGEDYNNWINDEYAVNWVTQQLQNM